MKISEHFTLDEVTYSETAIRLDINNQPNLQQLENIKIAAHGMERIRILLGRPIRINSWLRLPEVNVAVGGSKISSHINGWAIDFTCASYGDPYAVAKAIRDSDIKVDQCIHEFGRWVHVSFAPELRGQFLTIFKPENKYKTGILTELDYR